MNPALSVVVFTTLSGAGYGLLAVSALLISVGAFPGNQQVKLVALGVALILITTGLVSSTFHLGRPGRAWRAFSQWRSSWLSREGIAALLTFIPHLALIVAVARPAMAGHLTVVAGAGSIVGAVATVLSTAMIYASLRTVRAWHRPIVPVVYLVFALATGLAWLSAISGGFGQLTRPVAIAGMLSLALAWLLKIAYWSPGQSRRIASDINSATSLPGKVRPLDPPHTEENYLLKEMGYRIARRHAAKLRRLALALGAVLPVFCLSLFGQAALLAIPAALLATLGTLIERWLFFAEAKHTVSLYYGEGVLSD